MATYKVVIVQQAIILLLQVTAINGEVDEKNDVITMQHEALTVHLAAQTNVSFNGIKNGI